MLKKISNILFKYISKNFGWKLFSIVFAVILWFIVMNIINPTEIQTYSVNITFLNEDKLTEKGFVVMNKEELLNTKAEIKVKSTRTALDELNKNEKDITATVDLKQFAMLYADDVNEPFKVAVTPSIPNSYVYTYELVNFTPGEISIKLDNIVETQKDVIIDSEGEVPNGYLAGEPSVEPASVKIKGASSQIASVDAVKVSIDMSDISEDVIKNFEPVAYDKDGNEIESLIIEPNTVKVSFGVYKYGQIEVEKPEIEGFAAPNYMITGIDWEPKYIEVVGDENEISEIASIKPKVKLSGQSDEKIVLNYDVNAHIAKNKISIKEGSKKEVTVTITLEREQFKNFSIDRDNITTTGLNNDYMVILPSEIKVNLKGGKDALDNIKSGDVTVSFNLSGLSEGTHSVEAIINLPNDVSLTEKVYSQIQIVKYASDNDVDNNNSNATETNTMVENSTDSIINDNLETVNNIVDNNINDTTVTTTSAASADNENE